MSEKASLQIAVKDTKANTSGVERVKLLQEAAIMGQFSHPHVVKLYGLVTVKDPVSTPYLNGEITPDMVVQSPLCYFS